MFMDNDKISDDKKCTSFVCQFDGHASKMHFRMHHPMEEVQGHIGGHWKPPLGEYSHPIALVAFMVIDFGVKKWFVVL
jgi:hypothetical protein